MLRIMLDTNVIISLLLFPSERMNLKTDNCRILFSQLSVFLSVSRLVRHLNGIHDTLHSTTTLRNILT